MGTTQRVYLAVPIYGMVDPHFFRHLINLIINGSEVPLQLAPHVGDSLVPRARNSLTAAFLNTDCTDLLFVDSDLIFSADHIKRIMSHDVDVVGGFYPKKQDGEEVHMVCNALDTPAKPQDDGLVPMKYMGTGFLRVRRSVFEKMIEKFGEELRYHPDHSPMSVEYDFWRVGTYRYGNGFKRYLSEDWYFCQMCHDMGVPVWGDTNVVLKHSGNAVYPLQHQAAKMLAQAQAPGEPTSASAGAAAVPTATAPVEVAS